MACMAIHTDADTDAADMNADANAIGAGSAGTEKCQRENRSEQGFHEHLLLRSRWIVDGFRFGMDAGNLRSLEADAGHQTLLIEDECIGVVLQR